MEIIEEDVIQEQYGTDFKNPKSSLLARRVSESKFEKLTIQNAEDCPTSIVLRCKSGMSSGFNMRYYDPRVGEDPPSQSELEPNSAFRYDDGINSSVIGYIESPSTANIGLRKINGL